jgi:hypothetical protein
MNLEISKRSRKQGRLSNEMKKEVAQYFPVVTLVGRSLDTFGLPGTISKLKTMLGQPPSTPSAFPPQTPKQQIEIVPQPSPQPTPTKPTSGPEENEKFDKEVELQMRCLELEDNLKEYKEVVNKFKSDLTARNQDVAKANNAFVDIRNKLTLIEEENNRLITANDGAEEEIERLRLLVIKSQKDAAKLEKVQQDAELNQVAALSANSELTALKEELERTKTTLDSTLKQNAVPIARVQELEAKIAELTGIISQQQDHLRNVEQRYQLEKDELCKKSQAALTRVSELANHRIQKLDSQCMEIASALSTRNAESADLAERLEQAESKLVIVKKVFDSIDVEDESEELVQEQPQQQPQPQPQPQVQSQPQTQVAVVVLAQPATPNVVVEEDEDDIPWTTLPPASTTSVKRLSRNQRQQQQQTQPQPQQVEQVVEWPAPAVVAPLEENNVSSSATSSSSSDSIVVELEDSESSKTPEPTPATPKNKRKVVDISKDSPTTPKPGRVLFPRRRASTPGAPNIASPPPAPKKAKIVCSVSNKNNALAYFTMPPPDKSGMTRDQYEHIIDRLAAIDWYEVGDFESVRGEQDTRVVISADYCLLEEAESQFLAIAENARSLFSTGSRCISIKQLYEVLADSGDAGAHEMTDTILGFCVQARTQEQIRGVRLELGRGVMLGPVCQQAWKMIETRMPSKRSAAEPIVIKNDDHFKKVMLELCNFTAGPRSLY